MELKDLVLSTLADMQVEEKERAPEPEVSRKEPVKEEPKQEAPQREEAEEKRPEPKPEPEAVREAKEAAADLEALEEIGRMVESTGFAPAANSSAGELAFLKNLRERLLVMFEGLQSPNNKSIEAKVDLILNFFEYLLALTEERIEAIEKKRAAR